MRQVQGDESENKAVGRSPELAQIGYGCFLSDLTRFPESHPGGPTMKMHMLP